MTWRTEHARLNPVKQAKIPVTSLVSGNFDFDFDSYRFGLGLRLGLVLVLELGLEFRVRFFGFITKCLRAWKHA